jgi:hypothetical protein
LFSDAGGGGVWPDSSNVATVTVSASRVARTQASGVLPSLITRGISNAAAEIFAVFPLEDDLIFAGDLFCPLQNGGSKWTIKGFA